MSTETCRAFVILNPGSGNSAPERVRANLGGSSGGNSRFEFHDLTPDDDLAGIVRRAVADGHDLVVAAGGDGTAAAVARALVGTSARLGILPLGTTNVLARELNIPLDLDAACRLLDGPNAVAEIDAMRVGDDHYFTQIGVGVDAYMIRDTTVANKKRFGPLAYVWTALVRLAGFRRRRFTIAADERRENAKGSQVLVVNSGTLGTSGLRWTPDARVDDGRVEVCVVRAKSAFDYAGVAWEVVRGRRATRHVRYLRAARSVAVRSDRPLPVQADGEVIGETPIEIRIAPRALKVVVPPGASPPA